MKKGGEETKVFLQSGVVFARSAGGGGGGNIHMSG